MLKRTPLKKGSKQLKKTSLKKQNPKTAKQKHKDREIERILDDKFYNEIWITRKQKSDLTGHWLGREVKTTFFHHLLPKHLYPQFRYKKWNILLCEDFYHNQIEIKPTNLPEDVYDGYIIALNGAKEKGEV